MRERERERRDKREREWRVCSFIYSFILSVCSFVYIHSFVRSFIFADDWHVTLLNCLSNTPPYLSLRTTQRILAFHWVFNQTRTPSTRMRFQKFAFSFHWKRNESIAFTRSFSYRPFPFGRAITGANVAVFSNIWVVFQTLNFSF